MTGCALDISRIWRHIDMSHRSSRGIGRVLSHTRPARELTQFVLVLDGRERLCDTGCHADTCCSADELEPAARRSSIQMLGIIRLALSRPYTFVVLALLIVIVGTLSALRT